MRLKWGIEDGTQMFDTLIIVLIFIYAQEFWVITKRVNHMRAAELSRMCSYWIFTPNGETFICPELHTMTKIERVGEHNKVTRVLDGFPQKKPSVSICNLTLTSTGQIYMYDTKDFVSVWTHGCIEMSQGASEKSCCSLVQRGGT